MMENRKRINKTTFTTGPAWIIICTTLLLNLVSKAKALLMEIRGVKVIMFIRLSSYPFESV
jgi:hypothetical protein